MPYPSNDDFQKQNPLNLEAKTKQIDNIKTNKQIKQQLMNLECICNKFVFYLSCCL